MVHAFAVYVRPLLECVWSAHLLKDITQIESVQKRFSQWLVGMSDLDYCHRLATLGLESLELRPLHHDLLCTYKILSNRMDINYETMFTVNSRTRTRGHQWKWCHKHCRVYQHKYLFAQRVVNPWNSLNSTLDDWSSVAKFRTLINKKPSCCWDGRPYCPNRKTNPNPNIAGLTRVSDGVSAHATAAERAIIWQKQALPP